MLLSAAQSFLLAFLGRSFTLISSTFSPVGELFAVVGNPIAFVRYPIALVSEPLAASHHPLLGIKRPLKLIVQPPALLFQVHVGGLELRCPLRDLRTAPLDLGAASLIASILPVGAQPRQIRAVRLKPRRRTFVLCAAPLELCPLSLSALLPPRSCRFVAVRAALVHPRRVVLGNSRVRHVLRRSFLAGLSAPRLLALSGSDLTVDLSLLSNRALLLSLRSRIGTVDGFRLTACAGPGPQIREPFTLIRGALPLVGKALALVRDPLALIR